MFYHVHEAAYQGIVWGMFGVIEQVTDGMNIPGLNHVTQIWATFSPYTVHSPYLIDFFPTNSQKTSRISPTRARYGVPFVTANFFFLCHIVLNIELYSMVIYGESTPRLPHTSIRDGRHNRDADQYEDAALPV